MPRFSANLSMLFGELPFMERFAAAASAGFGGVEYLFPYEHNAQQLADCLGENGLKQVLFNLPAGNWAAGDRGIACLPERRGEFEDGVGSAIEYAAALGCRQLNCLAGIPVGINAETAQATLVANLKFAAAALERAKIRLLIEPLNTRDVRGFFLTKSQQALSLMGEVGSDNLWLQFDVYHMQVMEGDLAFTIGKNIGRISHFQIADNPGRHEPGTGEINFPFLFSYIDSLGYDGWIGCEYKPATNTVAGLKWLSSVRHGGGEKA
jgi:hydroxypyruvate isomerase